MCLYVDEVATRDFSRNKKTDKDGYIKVYKKFTILHGRLVPYYKTGGYYYRPGFNKPIDKPCTRKNVKTQLAMDGFAAIYGGALHCCLTLEEAFDRGVNTRNTIILPVFIKKKDVIAVGRNRKYRDDVSDIAVSKLLIRKKDYERAVAHEQG